MPTRAIYLIANPGAREAAAEAIAKAPDGWVVEIRPPMHQITQEAKQGVPECFDSQADWDLYCADSWAIDLDPSMYCRDCTPARRNRMIAEGRCAYPDTVFVTQRDDGVVGLRRDEPGWYGALTGKYLGSGKHSPNIAVAPASAQAFEGDSKC